MNYNKNLLERADFILKNADDALIPGKNNESGSLRAESSKFGSFKASGLTFILDLFGSDHPYYSQFKIALQHPYQHNVRDGKEILLNIKAEIENGWFMSVKGLVSAEIFNDFLEMAEHLMDNGYKDPAAVMIGSVLEEHIRQLCVKNSIQTKSEKDGKTIHMKAESMNRQLTKEGVYNLLDQKNVTAQLDLRNKAAHGKYAEYDLAQVKLMYNAVFNFIIRHQL